jgi:hypothetical protein
MPVIQVRAWSETFRTVRSCSDSPIGCWASTGSHTRGHAWAGVNYASLPHARDLILLCGISRSEAARGAAPVKVRAF